MSEVPHCPDCNRADRVGARRGTYEYYCDNCDLVFDPDDVVDAAWIDMVANRMFDHPAEALDRAAHEYSDDCECQWCDRGRPGMDKINPN